MLHFNLEKNILDINYASILNESLKMRVEVTFYDLNNLMGRREYILFIIIT